MQLYYIEQQDASRIASQAGQMLLAMRQRLQQETFSEQALRIEADRASHAYITRALAGGYPHDAVLSEEGKDDTRRLQSQRVWIVDPLDGTREFSERRPDWTIHVALVVDEQPVIGAVALPALQRVFNVYPPEQTKKRVDGPLRIVVSRTRPPDFAFSLAQRLKAELIPMGSAGAKMMAVLQGETDSYVHAGGQYEWDSAAPAAVAAAAGLHVSRIDGRMLRYNQPEPWLPDLLVCRAELASEMLQALQACIQEKRG
jgi:3'(2'), 5'-bisphosphate nucleotidase